MPQEERTDIAVLAVGESFDEKSKQREVFGLLAFRFKNPDCSQDTGNGSVVLFVPAS